MKYPRTPYFTFSDSVDKEDVRESGYFDIQNFLSKELVVTIKMDGSNCLWTQEHIAARNGKQANGLSFNYAKQMHSIVKDRIPKNIYVYGEWLWAKHSIHYDNKMKLDGYFQVFGIYDIEKSVWRSWQDVVHYANLLDVINVPVVRTIPLVNNAKCLSEMITSIAKMIINQGHEGIVVRNINSFSNTEFNKNIAKYVRANHVQTDQYWLKQKNVTNKIKDR